MSWSPFPPQTEELQFDEKWAFVYQKEKRCDPDDPADDRRGDNWDHVVLDAEHRLVLDSVPGKRGQLRVRRAVESARRRLANRIPRLITSDEFRAYREEILRAWGIREAAARTGRPGRPRHGRIVAPPELLYATVHKTRKNGRVVKVEPRLVFGTEERLKAALTTSSVSRTVNTSFLERQNGTDRHRNSRKVRKTYRFSKDWDIHNACSCFAQFSYNFCWPVRTLAQTAPDGSCLPYTPAMAAGLTDHVWPLEEWLLFPARAS